MTKKKTLLKEGTVRQFMKLANLQPLASDFVGSLYEGGAKKGDQSATHLDYEGEDLEEGGAKKGDQSATDLDYEKNENQVNEQDELEFEDEVEMGGDELEGEDEVEDEVEEGGGDVDVTALVRAIADAVEEHTGVSVDVADEEGGEEDFGGEEELEFADEEEVDLGGEEEEEVELGGEEDLEEVISTIAENVTKRLQQMTSAKKKS